MVRFSRLLASLAVVMVVALVSLTGLRVAERNATLDRFVPNERRALVLWTEQRVQNPEGEVVQHVDTGRGEAANIANDLLTTDRWGLVARNRMTGRLDDHPRTLEVLEIETSIAPMLGLRACDPGELRPFTSQLTGTRMVAGDSAFRVGESAAQLPIALLTRKFSADAVRCVERIERGPFLIAEVPAAVTETAALKRLEQLSQAMYDSMLAEQVQVRDLQALLLEQQTLRGGWIRTVRWVVTGLFLILISTLLGLHAIGQQGSMAIRHVFGSVTRDQVLRRLRAVLYWILPAVALGWVLALLIGSVQSGMERSGLVLDSLLLILFSVAAAALNARRGSRRVMHSSGMLHRLLQGQWSTGSDRTLLAAWGLVAALLVCVSAVQGSLAGRLHQLTTIDWGYSVENLIALPISLPEVEVERSEYADRIRTMITEINHFPGVQSASVISQGPWQFRGLERVSGPFIQAFGVGPDIAGTMKLKSCQGRDFTWADITSGQAQAFQNISSQTRQMMSRFGPEIALLEGLRWDPLEPDMPRLIFKPITEVLPDSFELIWRGNPETLLSRDQLARIQGAWPEAVLDRPIAVADVIRFRYSALLNLQRLSAFALAASLLVAFVLTGATLAQLLVRHQRALAIRVALGATPRQALRPLLGRVLATLMAGSAVGVFVAWIMGRVIGALVEHYQSQWLLSATGVALVVACVGAMAVAFAIWKLRRLDLRALLSDL